MRFGAVGAERGQVRFGSLADFTGSTPFAIPPKAEITRTGPGMSAKCQKRKSTGLFDHIVGDRQQCLGTADARRFRGLEVDGQREFRWLLNGQFGGPGTLQDTVNKEEPHGAAVHPNSTRTTKQTTRLHVLPALKDGRQLRLLRKFRNYHPVLDE